ncbi:response regulator transcription factor [Arcobacter sp. CECT 8985]|uniref:response regulator transcription factor n=1 Tax=Arcobacter sp. CECT 8985 TaxID=1935424 RepID=UPI00100B6FE2|nr:response regulator transcription factor [Arcobacter sp. CECT 8985]RXJ86282.1 DNA-binding response regulator [Arcobacter sp. CECT 8985]
MSLNEFKNIKLLYVEDEADIRKYAMSYFKRLFNKTYEASNVSEAFEVFSKQKPQIIITDIKMPKSSGLDFIKKVRQVDSKCQIIVLSAFLDTKYLLDAISLNLVKYLTKPIKHDELYLALCDCVKNILNQEQKLIYFSKESYFDTINKNLYLEQNQMKITPKELNFLELLINNKNRTICYQEIENHIWYDSVMSENALRILVKKLRKKLPHNTLENVARMGYKINLYSQ